jgi:hypothetical protein
MKAYIDEAHYKVEKGTPHYYTTDRNDTIHRRAVSPSAEPVLVWDKIEGVDSFNVSKQESLIALSVGKKVLIRNLEKPDKRPREIGRHRSLVNTVCFTGEDFDLLSGDATGIVKYWPLKQPTGQVTEEWKYSAGNRQRSPGTVG